MPSKRFYRHRYTAILAILLVLRAWSAANGADSYTRTYSVDEIVRMARSNYALLAAEREKANESRYAAGKAGEVNNPTLGFEYAQKRLGDKGYRFFGINASQDIPVTGKRTLRYEIAKIEENLALLSFDEMNTFIEHEVTRLSYEYAVSLFRSQHIKDRLRRLALINSYIKGRILIAPQKIVESRIIGTKILTLERDVQRLQTDQRLAFEKLNLYAGLKDGSPPFIQVDWFDSAPEVSLPEILEKSRTRGFAIRRQKEYLKKAEKHIALARRDPYPDPGLSVYYNEQNSPPTERTLGVGISFPIPLFSMNKNEIARFEASARSERALLEFAERAVESELLRLHAEYEFASAQLKRFPVKMMDELENDMRYADEEFRKGRVDFQTYFEMERQTHETLEYVLETQLSLVKFYRGILFLTGGTEKPAGRNTGETRQ